MRWHQVSWCATGLWTGDSFTSITLELYIPMMNCFRSLLSWAVLSSCFQVSLITNHHRSSFPLSSSGSRCCFTLDTHTQRPAGGHRGGNAWCEFCFVSFTCSDAERSPAFGLCFFLGGLRFYTEVHQQRCRQREPEAGPHTAGAVSQGTGPPPVSIRQCVH